MKCLALLLLMINLVFAKKYERCELAKELYEKHDVASNEIGVLVCIAEHASILDTRYTDNFHYGLFAVFLL